jgi:predicted nucleotidyltransferase
MRERRRLGTSREARIRQVIASLADRIRLLFIFGSAARGEQHAESDIDLMVVGDVTLRQLSPALKQAEQELGRQVNAVVLREAEWRQRRLHMDAFTKSILEQPKVFIIGDANELEAMAGQLLDSPSPSQSR